MKRKFYTMKIDKIDMQVKELLTSFNGKTIDGVLLNDDSIYCFNAYSWVEFNGHRFRIGDSAENKMLEDAFLTVQALDNL